MLQLFHKTLGLLSLLVILLNWRCAEALPFGAPVASCITLSPSVIPHGSAQVTPSPYQVDLSFLADGTGHISYIPGRTYLSKYSTA